MSVIKILSDQEAKKIAAGEVVERPASVVKEIIENSLDAGATKVTLHIEKAGKKLIRVVDNGCGMMPDDAKLCFANHATSKVTSLSDLQTLSTFGFRGEALASISSVSKVVLQTRFHDQETGVLIEYREGKVCEEKVIACASGTDLSIGDLFYNTPVRQKFLKQDETEWNQIQNLFYAFCLSNVSVHFQLYRDGRMVLQAPSVEKITDRVMQIWDHNLAQNMVELVIDDNKISKNKISENKNKTCKISGLISRHNFWRYGRQQMFFFVNGRWVKNSELSKGLLKGYRGVLPPARFPAAFLFFTLDSSLVDINVHPRKEEVRFARPVSVTNTLQKFVTQTLEKLLSKQLSSVATKPEVFVEDFSQTNSLQNISQNISRDTRGPVSSVMGTGVPEVVLQNYGTNNFTNNPWAQNKIIQNKIVQNKTEVQKETQKIIAPQESAGKIIGQLLNTYIVVENKSGLVLIDQHAAHERILYEKYLKIFEHKDGTRLIFPEIIKLGEHKLKLVLQEKDFLNQQGIEVEQIGVEELAIKTSPPKLQAQSLRDLIFEMIEFIESNDMLEQEVFRKKLNEHVHSHMACKMAVRAGDKLSHEMMSNIITDLCSVDNRFICVHGRPTTWSMSVAELEKTFRRR